MEPTETVPTGLDSSPCLDQLLPALLACQRAIDPALKSAQNPHYQRRYADLGDVWAACREPLGANGLVVMFPIEAGGSVHGITCYLAHTSGQWVRSRMVLEGNLKDPQKFGSAITYARRYLLSALLAITTEDDDGQAASPPRQKEIDANRRQSTPEVAGKAEARQSYASWVAGLEVRVRDYWQNQLKMAGIPRDQWKAMPTQFQITNHLSKHAISKGLWTEEEVLSEGKGGELKHDRSKAAKLVAELFARAPAKIEAHVRTYLAEHEKALRAELDMAPLEEPEDRGEAYDSDVNESPAKNGAS